MMGKKSVEGAAAFLSVAASGVNVGRFFFGDNVLERYGYLFAAFFFAGLGVAWGISWLAGGFFERRERVAVLRALTVSARALLARFAPSGELLEVANFFKGDVERLKIGAVVVPFAPTDARQLLDAGLLSLVQSSRDNFGDVSVYKITPKGVEFYGVGVKAGLFDGLED